MSAAISILGRGLVSALGPDLASACATLRAGVADPPQQPMAGGATRPFRLLHGDPGLDWHARARRAIEAALGEAGCTDRELPLFIASSSRDGSAAVAAGDPFRPLRFGADLAAWLDWRGPIRNIDTACTSSLNALASARRLMRAGLLDEAIVLGVELDHRLSPGGFHAMQMLTATRAQPFGIARDGMLLGEAVAALRIGSGEARWRVSAVANVVDGGDPAGATQAAVEQACREAIEEAGLRPSDIGLVKVQASGSVANDAVEARALRAVFGTLPPLVSLKPALGHCLGASGAAEIALLCAAQEAACLPRFGGEPDPALGVCLSDAPRIPARHTLALILGFGGGHAAAIVEDMEAA